MLDLSQICWDQPKIQLHRRLKTSTSAGGVTNKKDLGPALWRVEMVSYALPFVEADALYAKMLSAEMSSVLIRASDHNWQVGHEGYIGGVQVTGVNGSLIRLTGIPLGYELPEGARLSVISATGREFFQTLSAGSDGYWFDVFPEVRQVSNGASVELTPPRLEVVIDPASIQQQREGVTRRRVSFSGVQVIR